MEGVRQTLRDRPIEDKEKNKKEELTKVALKYKTVYFHNLQYLLKILENINETFTKPFCAL